MWCFLEQQTSNRQSLLLRGPPSPCHVLDLGRILVDELGSMTVRTLAVSLLAVVLLSACGDPPLFRSLKADRAFPGQPRDRAEFDALFEFEQRPQCVLENARDLGLEGELRIFRGKRVDDEQVQRFLGGLQRYWSNYGIDCFTRYEIIDVPLSFALILDEPRLLRRIKKKTGINPLGPTTAAEDVILERAAARAILHNAIEFIGAYSVPARPAVNFVILPRMVDDEMASADLLGGFILGLGLSPRLVQDAPESEDLFGVLENAGIPQDFTPTAFVGVDTTNRLLGDPDSLVAHEVGHAYGLPHLETFGNLMHPSEFQLCAGGLDDAQLSVVSEGLAPAARISGTDMVLSLSDHPQPILDFAAGLTTRARSVQPR